MAEAPGKSPIVCCCLLLLGGSVVVLADVCYGMLCSVYRSTKGQRKVVDVHVVGKVETRGGRV